MKLSLLAKTTAAAGAVLLSACASPGLDYGNQQPLPATANSGYYASQRVNYGIVDSIQATNVAPAGGIGAGTVIGGLLGGVLGNQVGGGTGNTVATIAGVVGGAVAGNQIEKNTNRGGPAYNVRVRLNNGAYQDFGQDNVSDLRPGDRVRIENGRVYRY